MRPRSLRSFLLLGVAVARHIQEILARDGIESRIYEKEPGRGNIVARLKGSGAKRSLLLMGHIDVVGVEPADLYRNPENPARTAEVQEKLRLRDPSANSMIRTSISPTIINGGFRSNVILAYGHDERVSVEGMGDFVRHLYQTVLEVAGK